MVSTPIGNLYDMSLRAAAVLKHADVIACEDTRVTKKLLQHWGLWAQQKLLTVNDHNERAQAEHLIAAAAQGARVAVVSDAGTPTISDPGFLLVQQAIAQGVKVIPVPGPSAVMAALVIAGLPMDTFHFVGFLPSKAGERQRLLKQLAAQDSTVVCYEAPHRLCATLRDLVEIMPTRAMAVLRELTKLFEEAARGTPETLLAHFSQGTRVRGECVIVIGPGAAASDLVTEDITSLLRQAMMTGSTKDAVRQVAEMTGLPRKELYALALGLVQGDAS